jgi:hypothetical protein
MLEFMDGYCFRYIPLVPCMRNLSYIPNIFP